MRFRAFGFGLLAAGALAPGGLTLLGPNQPRAFFFRQSEGTAIPGRMPYAEWDRGFSRLMGIMGKALDEEIVGRSAGLGYFVRFKQEHPDQAVILHLNGDSRLPTFEPAPFFAGDWLYFNGATVRSNVVAEAGESTFHLNRVDVFKLRTGRLRNLPDDIGLCSLDAAGRPDWRNAEQVQLVSIDPLANTIRVRRGCYGTQPRAFEAGRAYVAAHCTEGPWGSGTSGHLLWEYNYSTTCPRDGSGRTCADVFAAQLAGWLGKGGPLAAFDGLEFDIFFNVPNLAINPDRRVRGPDCDADGRRDDGVIDGVNAYGSGVMEFLRHLRSILGPDRLILADGSLRDDQAQRGFDVLNGIESEGWPNLFDNRVHGWSSGLNRFNYWRENAFGPAFNYVNHKYRQPDVGFNIDRLVFAGAVLTDAGVTYTLAPPAADGPRRSRGAPAIWDELDGGTARQPGWLGRALGPADHLALARPDLLGGREGRPSAWLHRLTVDHHETVSTRSGRFEMRGTNSAAKWLTVRLPGIAAPNDGVVVFLTARGDPAAGAPPEMARRVYAALVPTGQELPRNAPGDWNSPETPAGLMSFVGRRDFAASFYFDQAPANTVDLVLNFESGAPVWITDLSIHPGPDCMVRRFEHGLVLANPSPQPAEFDLRTLAPGESFRRLEGTPGQDPTFNDGRPVGNSLSLGPKDAIFLWRKE